MVYGFVMFCLPLAHYPKVLLVLPAASGMRRVNYYIRPLLSKEISSPQKPLRSS